MTQLSVELPDELSDFVDASVANGDYPDAGSVIRNAVAGLQLENEARLTRLKALIQEGYDSGFTEEDPFEAIAREMGWEWDG